MSKNRFDRQLRLFGAEGQARLAGHTLAVVGAGGLGSIAIQQAAHLGVGRIAVIDHESADETNLNRYVSLRHADIYIKDGIATGAPLKTALAKRMIREVQPACNVECIPHPLRHKDALAKLRQADSIIGCVDNDAARLVLTDVARALDTLYVDLASDIEAKDKVRIGGRVFCADSRRGCLNCAGELDREEASVGILDASVTEDRDAIYGVDKALLAEKGPSVIMLNGIIASIGMIEWLVAVVGIRKPRKALYYRGLNGTVSVNDSPDLDDYCYYCDEIRGRPDKSAYLRAYPLDPVCSQ